MTKHKTRIALFVSATLAVVIGVLAFGGVVDSLTHGQRVANIAENHQTKLDRLDNELDRIIALAEFRDELDNWKTVKNLLDGAAHHRRQADDLYWRARMQLKNNTPNWAVSGVGVTSQPIWAPPVDGTFIIAFECDGDGHLAYRRNGKDKTLGVGQTREVELRTVNKFWSQCTGEYSLRVEAIELSRPDPNPYKPPVIIPF